MFSRVFGSRGTGGHKQLSQDEERERCREMLTQRSQEKKRDEAGRSGGALAVPPQSSSPHTLPGGQVLLTIVRSAVWVEDEGGEEDLWQLEMEQSATVADVKLHLEEMYGMPVGMQRLQSSPELGGACFPDSMSVKVLAQQPFHLLPAQEAHENFTASADLDDEGMRQAVEQGFLRHQAAQQEEAEAFRAIEASLQGVSYKVRFLRPESAGGSAQGKSIFLTLDAMSLIGDVQVMVEMELFGSVGAERAILAFNGTPLPPHLPLHFAGVGDGDTVIVAAESCFGAGMSSLDDEEDDFDSAMQHWAA